MGTGKEEICSTVQRHRQVGLVSPGIGDSQKQVSLNIPFHCSSVSAALAESPARKHKESVIKSSGFIPVALCEAFHWSTQKQPGLPQMGLGKHSAHIGKGGACAGDRGGSQPGHGNARATAGTAHTSLPLCQQ